MSQDNGGDDDDGGCVVVVVVAIGCLSKHVLSEARQPEV